MDPSLPGGPPPDGTMAEPPSRLPPPQPVPPSRGPTAGAPQPPLVRPAAPLLRQARPRRLLTPFRTVVVVAVLGAGVLIAFGLVNRTASQIPILAAGLAVLGLTFAAIAIACVVTIVRAGRDGRTARAFWAAIGGGLAVLIASGCLAAAIVLSMVWGSAAG